MENATTIALSRLVAQQRAMDITAGNIANATTPGFRTERLMFSDFLVRQPGHTVPGDTKLVYAQDRASYRDRQSGPLTRTANPLDLALTGDGYFTVGTKAGPRLTRAGHFSLAADGTVIDDAANPLLDAAGQPIRASSADTTFTVTGDGVLASENGPIATIGVVAPADPLKLKDEGGRLLNASDTSTGKSPDSRVMQGTIEESSVKPTVEVTRMMTELREFQFVTQFIQSEGDRQQGAIDKILRHS